MVSDEFGGCRVQARKTYTISCQKFHGIFIISQASAAYRARQQNMQFLSLFLIPMMMAMVHSTRRNYGEKRQLMDDLKCFQLVAQLETTQTAQHPSTAETRKFIWFQDQSWLSYTFLVYKKAQLVTFDVGWDKQTWTQGQSDLCFWLWPGIHLQSHWFVVRQQRCFHQICARASSWRASRFAAVAPFTLDVCSFHPFRSIDLSCASWRLSFPSRCRCSAALNVCHVFGSIHFWLALAVLQRSLLSLWQDVHIWQDMVCERLWKDLGRHFGNLHVLIHIRRSRDCCSESWETHLHLFGVPALYPKWYVELPHWTRKCIGEFTWIYNSLNY